MLFAQSLRKGLPALLIALALSACGPSETQNGSPAYFQWNVTSSPSSISVAVPADPNMPPSTMPCDDPVNNPQSLVTIPVTVVVTDDRGIPRGDVEITIFVDFAPGTIFGAAPLTALFDGAQVAVPYTTTTDDIGAKTVAIGFLVAPGCAYAGSLTVTSGILGAQTSFDVTVQ